MKTPVPPVRFTHGDHDISLHVHADVVSRAVRRGRGFVGVGLLEALAASLPPTGVVVDAAAGFGHDAVYLAAVAGRRVVAVEPDPSLAALLGRNVTANELRGLVEVRTPDVLAHGIEDVALVLAGPGAVTGDGSAGLLDLLAQQTPLLATPVRTPDELAALEQLLPTVGYRPVLPLGGRDHPHVIWVHGTQQAAPAPLERAALVEGLDPVRGHAPLAPVPRTPEALADDRPPHVLVVGGDEPHERAAELAGVTERVSSLRLAPARVRGAATWCTFRDGALVLDETEHVAVGVSMSSAEFVGLDRVLRDPPTVILFEYSFALIGAVRRLAALLEVPYVVLFRDDDDPLPWTAWPFLNGARARLIPPGIDEAAWKQRTILDATPLERADASELVAVVGTLATRRGPRPATPSAPGRTRLLLVSYYMPPAASVAMQRLTYWHTVLPELAAERGIDLTVDVVTASEGVANDDRYTVLLDRELDHPVGAGAAEAMAELEGIALNHVGATWAPYVRDWLAQVEPYDVAVLSGNPFHYFELADDLDRAGTGVVLDFRDPFASNPRFTYTRPQQRLVDALEASYVEHADAVISVNDTCLDLIASPEHGRPQQRASIPNGYDERVVDSVAADASERDHRTTFVYAGTFFEDRDPRGFLGELDPARHQFLHVGRGGFEREAVEASPAARAVGLRTYTETLAILKAADAGLIFTAGDPFEQTTKVFDYIGADIPIVIVTAGEPRTGELHAVTRGLEEVHWVRADTEEIRDFLATFEPRRIQRSRRTAYSRRTQAARVLDLALQARQQQGAPA